MPYDINLNMMDPAFRYEHGALLNTQVANPFRNYLTPDKFPGALRNNVDGDARQPARALSAVRRDHSRRNTNGPQLRTHTFELRAQRPFTKGSASSRRMPGTTSRVQEWFDDLAQYRVF